MKGKAISIICKCPKNYFIRYKTGDFPPTDIQLEEMELARNTKASSMTRFMNVNFGKKREKLNLFQKKRKIMKDIEKHKSEILKGTYSLFNDNSLI